MQNGEKFPGIATGIFLKTYSREFPNGNFQWPWHPMRVRDVNVQSTLRHCVGLRKTMDMDAITRERFIALIQSHPIIYDLSSHGHDLDRRTKIWTTIAPEFNLAGLLFRPN